MGRSITAVAPTEPWPTIKPLDTKNIGGSMNTNKPEGFLGNGDYFLLPLASGNDIEYYNNADSQVWAIDKTTLLVASDKWIGFWLNDDKSLLYVVTMENSTVPETYQLSTINAAGTIVAIGAADQPSTDSTTYGGDYNVSIASAGGSMIQPNAAGDIEICITQTAGDLGIAVMDISTGQFTAGFSAVPGAPDSTFYGGYKTADGIYFSPAAYGANALAGIFDIFYGNQNRKVQITPEFGFPFASNGVRFHKWGGDVQIVDEAPYIIYGGRAWNASVMDAAVLKLAKMAGIQI